MSIIIIMSRWISFFAIRMIKQYIIIINISISTQFILMAIFCCFIKSAKTFSTVSSIQVWLLQTLLSLLLPHNTKLKEEIEEVLDVELIQQQVENGSLDFPVSILKLPLGLYSCSEEHILFSLNFNTTKLLWSLLCSFFSEFYVTKYNLGNSSI